MANELLDAARAAPSDPAAVKTLRAAGYAGVDALASVHRAKPDEMQAAQVDDAVKRAFDAVCGQRHGWWSRLYWHESIEPALEAAGRERKPILSVRMLGRLDEDLCCANSRFFRTILYADAEISKTLREKFVLHWASVRPVPKLTVDFGDGRKLERTITGNAAHLVLDAAARPVDCIPGLYGPGAFKKRLAWAESTAREVDPCPAHDARQETLFIEWAKDAEAIGLGPSSKEAAKAASKGGVAAGVEILNRAMSDDAWKKLSQRHFEETHIDARARRLMREGLPGRGGDDPGFAMTKRVVEDPLMRVLRPLQQSLAEDGVRNEYDLHRRVHEKFADGRAERDAQAFTDWVYTELFHMPPGDPFLGLAPVDAFTAITGGGENDPDA